VGFISGVHASNEKSLMLSGVSRVLDVCHLALSKHIRIMSSGYSSKNRLQKRTHTNRIAIRNHAKD
jgi:hypothetical protein